MRKEKSKHKLVVKGVSHEGKAKRVRAAKKVTRKRSKAKKA